MRLTNLCYTPIYHISKFRCDSERQVSPTSHLCNNDILQTTDTTRVWHVDIIAQAKLSIAVVAPTKHLHTHMYIQLTFDRTQCF